MYLKSLELAGFKSFAKKASLEFNSSITGIVGPNGSGKSNIAEAFRFVLGEQSIKSLRGKRGEDLIWNGGGEGLASSMGRANRASVKLVFDNKRRIFPNIDFDEVILERIVHRDNSNEYVLNGSHVRLKDILELLATAHVGATGHHIISQGEADRILSSSIRERREIVEDALGLKIYQWKKLESLRKLEKTEDNMKQVESLRREIAPHLKFLKKQVEKVEKAEQMRRELVQVYKEYFAYEEFYIKAEKERLNNELFEPQKELKELDEALALAKQILTSSKNKDKKSDEVIELEKVLSEIRAEKDRLTRELGRIEGEITVSDRALNRERAKLADQSTKTVYVRDVEEVISRIEGFRAIEDVKQLFTEVVKALRDFVGKHKDNIDSSIFAEMEKDIERLRKDKLCLEETLQSMREKESRETRNYNDIKAAIEKEKDTNREAEKEVFRIIARQNELRNKITSLQLHLQTVLHDEEVFKKDLGEAGVLVGREATLYEAALTAQTRSEQESRRRNIEKIKIRLEDSGGAGGADVMREFRETEERDVFLARELEDLVRAKEELLKLIADLEMRLDYEFKSGILKINTEFQRFFALMFGGGRAELKVVKEPKRRKKSDSQELNDMLGDENSALLAANLGSNGEESEENGPEGLDVEISLPRKKIKGLVMLSGGERALTSIALLFAVSQVNPPPFIILDETDAALDEANSKKYGDMIEELSKNSQLILITHNRETMSRAGVIYGITMGAEGGSRLLSIAFEDAVKVAK